MYSSCTRQNRKHLVGLLSRLRLKLSRAHNYEWPEVADL